MMIEEHSMMIEEHWIMIEKYWIMMDLEILEMELSQMKFCRFSAGFLSVLANGGYRPP